MERNYAPEPSMRQCVVALLDAYRRALQDSEPGDDSKTTAVWAAAFVMIDDLKWRKDKPSQALLERLHAIAGNRLWEYRP